jgi:hypothetical protein
MAFRVEKSSTQTFCHFCSFLKLAQGKQSAIGRKFAKSGRPAANEAAASTAAAAPDVINNLDIRYDGLGTDKQACGPIH